MQAYLHIAQLVDLQREGPEAALRWWEKTTLRYRILVRLGSTIDVCGSGAPGVAVVSRTNGLTICIYLQGWYNFFCLDSLG